jgi:uncharacterized Zn finger protein
VGLRRWFGRADTAPFDPERPCTGGHTWRAVSESEQQIVRCKRCGASSSFPHHELWGITNLVCGSTSHTLRPVLDEQGDPVGVKCARCGDLWTAGPPGETGSS